MAPPKATAKAPAGAGAGAGARSWSHHQPVVGERFRMLVADTVAVGAATAAVSWSASWSAILVGVIAIAALAATGLYRPRLRPSALDDAPRAVLGIGVTWAVDGWVAPPVPAPPGVPGAFLWWLAVVGCVVLGRAVVYADLRRRRRSGGGERAVVVGVGRVSVRLAEVLLTHPEYGLRPVGFVGSRSADEVAEPPVPLPVPLLGPVDALSEIVAERQARHVVVAFSASSDADLVAPLRACRERGCTVFMVPRLYEMNVSGIGAELVHSIPLIRMRSTVQQLWRWRVKRVIDVVGAVLLLVLLSPLLLACALAVRWEIGRDGVLFRQERVSRDGRRFMMVKFRSLSPSSDLESQMRWSISEDNRVGPVGRLLRRTSLDELPQLVNVLRGDMSLVGPRPERPFFVEKFQASYLRYTDRHRVSAGITGWAQVHGLRGDTSIEDRASYDNYYIENWSLGLDIKILLRTLGSVLYSNDGGRGVDNSLPAVAPVAGSVAGSRDGFVVDPGDGSRDGFVAGSRDRSVAGSRDGSRDGSVAGPRSGVASSEPAAAPPARSALAAVGMFLRRPSLLVAATIVAVCVPMGNNEITTSVSVTPADLAGLLLVAVVAARALAGDRPLPGGVWLPFAAALGASAAATVASYSTVASLTGFVRYTELFVFLPVAVALAVRDRRDLFLTCGTVLAVSVVQGGMGVWQYLTGTGASYAGQDVRAVGTFGALDIMGMSTVVGFGIVVALGLGLAWRGPGRAALLVTAAALTVPLAFSLSRGSWIATVCAAGATIVAAGWRLAIRTSVFALALAVILIGGFGIGSQMLTERLTTIASSTSAPDQSVADRYGLWRTAAGIWVDHPVLGVGPKHFATFRDGYAPLAVSSASDVADSGLGFRRMPLLSPHNMYLLVLSEQGLVGLLAFCALLGALAVWAVRRSRAPGPESALFPGCFPDRFPDRFLDLVAPGIVVWTGVNFLYGDVGGPSSVFLAVMLGLVVRRGLGSWRTGPDQPQVPARDPEPPAPAVPALAPPPPAPPLPPPAPEPPAPKFLVPSRPRRVSKGGLALSVALVSVLLSVLGSLLGLGRDLMLATFFGATGGTDAFLVAWTVPETAAPLLIEGALTFLMIPVFSRALERGESAGGVVAATLPRICAVLVALAGLTAVAAPVLVGVLAPGLADPHLAVASTRLVAITVLMFGLAGYLSAALRAHHVFITPAAIYIAYNVGIIGAIVALHGRMGILSAAVGVAVGSVLMVAVQLPGFLRHVGMPHRGAVSGSLITLGAFVPIAVFTLTRQAQVFVERFLGSSLEPGTISHLNYAQKVAQVPMVLALVLTTMTFPALARGMAAGEAAEARRRIERDLRTVGALVLLACAYLAAYAPAVVRVLFEHGRFTSADTAATVTILRVYLLGLLGHAVVGALSRPFFAADRPTWYPALAMAAGLATTMASAAVAVGPWGAGGIAAANAAGITVAAVLLLTGLRTRMCAVSPRVVAVDIGRLALASAGAGAAGAGIAHLAGGLPPLALALLGMPVVLFVFCLLVLLMAPGEVKGFVWFAARRLLHGQR